MMVAGVLLANWTMLRGEATVMFTAYPPLEASTLYYVGVLLFAVGVLIAIGLFFANVIGARRDGTYTGSLPLVVYGLATAAIIGVYSLATGAVAYGALLLCPSASSTPSTRRSTGCSSGASATAHSR
jgi:cytochrome c oxidase subunit I